MSPSDNGPGPVTHGVAMRAADGEDHCGDAAVVETLGSRVVFGVIDGLGHGVYAEAAARAAADSIRHHAAEDPVAVLRRCHDHLRTTRGAAVSLAVLDHGRAEWLAVGNVQGVIHHATPRKSTRLVTRAGIVGSRMPQLRNTHVAVEPGDVLVMFTDGVEDAAARDTSTGREPSAVAERLLGHHATGRDDALVLVARWDGARV